MRRQMAALPMVAGLVLIGAAASPCAGDLDGDAVDALVAGYGKRQVLSGVTVDVAPGDVLGLIGHSGAGKSTLLRAVFGTLPIWSGNVVLDGTRQV